VEEGLVQLEGGYITNTGSAGLGGFSPTLVLAGIRLLGHFMNFSHPSHRFPVRLPVLAAGVLALAQRLPAQSPVRLDLQISAAYARLTITGAVGSVCTVQCRTNLAQTNWLTLDTLALTNTSQSWTDTNSATNGARWYRTLVQPVTCRKYSYGTSEMGRDLFCDQIQPVSTNNRRALLNYQVHGFEDGWAHDGYSLTLIANLVKAYYLANPAALNGWTVYLNPGANPDGAINGSNAYRVGESASAFGRCVLNATDINRSFSQNKNTEQLKLATLVTNVSPTIIIDFHGWCNGYIAKDAGTNVGNYFYSSFNASYSGKPSKYGYVGYVSGSGSPDGPIYWTTAQGGGPFTGKWTMTSDMFAEWANSVKKIPATIIEYPAPAYSNPGGSTYDTVYDATLGFYVISPTVRDSMVQRTEVALNSLFLTYQP
jgi:hypothetical protein